GDPRPGDPGLSPDRIRAARAHPRARRGGHAAAERVARDGRALRRPGHQGQGGVAMKPARSLIVNADDYGLTAGVSRGIIDAHRRGIVTSTTLLVNRPVDPALIEALQSSGLGVGLHMNLTLGPPVAPAKRVASLLDGEGRFVRDAREAARRARPDEARIELG